MKGIGIIDNVEYIECSSSGQPFAPFFPSLHSAYLANTPKLKGWWHTQDRRLIVGQDQHQHLNQISSSSKLTTDMKSVAVVITRVLQGITSSPRPMVFEGAELTATTGRTTLSFPPQLNNHLSNLRHTKISLHSNNRKAVTKELQYLPERSLYSRLLRIDFTTAPDWKPLQLAFTVPERVLWEASREVPGTTW